MEPETSQSNTTRRGCTLALRKRCLAASPPVRIAPRSVRRGSWRPRGAGSRRRLFLSAPEILRSVSRRCSSANSSPDSLFSTVFFGGMTERSGCGTERRIFVRGLGLAPPPVSQKSSKARSYTSISSGREVSVILPDQYTSSRREGSISSMARANSTRRSVPTRSPAPLSTRPKATAAWSIGGAWISPSGISPRPTQPPDERGEVGFGGPLLVLAVLENGAQGCLDELLVELPRAEGDE